MKRNLLLTIALLASAINSFSQKEQFNDLTNKMFFNIFIHKPDSLVHFFIEKYLPAYAKEYVPGGWTTYSPGPDPEFQEMIHSFKFKKHPWFDVAFREGQLDIFKLEEKTGEWSLKDFQLWFIFNSKKQAKIAFKKLSAMYNPLCTTKNSMRKKGNHIAEYSDEPNLESPDEVLFIMTKDKLYKGRYKILFRLGGYKDIQQSF